MPAVGWAPSSGLLKLERQYISGDGASRSVQQTVVRPDEPTVSHVLLGSEILYQDTQLVLARIE